MLIPKRFIHTSARVIRGITCICATRSSAGMRFARQMCKENITEALSFTYAFGRYYQTDGD